MFLEEGTKIKNRYTGKQRVIVRIEDNPVVYVTDDGVRRDKANMIHWELDESESNAE